jgi:putative SOS response-associated peptidase YedK
MCARFTIKSSPADIAAQFELPSVPELVPRYNVAPTQTVPVVRLGDADRELVALRWGLVPSWASDIKIGTRMLNARAETVATKPAFRVGFRKRRCLLVADGYYEWATTSDGKKQPYYYQLADGGPFAFAGLWERWQREDQVVESCTIITTDANDLAREVHDRMPVILDRQSCAAWLDHEVEDPTSLLRPFPAEAMKCRPVNRFVNNSRNEGPTCIEPAA